MSELEVCSPLVWGQTINEMKHHIDRYVDVRESKEMVRLPFLPYEKDKNLLPELTLPKEQTNMVKCDGMFACLIRIMILLANMSC